MIWVILPAYNEEDSLPLLLPKIAGILGSRRVAHRIVVVNDGSSDRTADVLERYGDLALDVVTHPINRGLGETERDAFEYVAGRCHPDDIVVRMDCDDTHEPEYIFQLIERLDHGYDVVNTSRFRAGGGQVGVGAYRAAISRAANLFMKVLFPIAGMRDYSCGYRAYRGKVLQDAIRIYGDNFIQLRGLGFTSTLEMVVKLHMLGCRFAEIPFLLRYDQKRSPSKMVSSVTTLGYIVMAVLHHWPFGGWRRSYRGLDRLYRKDANAAVETYSGRRGQRLPGTVSRIGL